MEQNSNGITLKLNSVQSVINDKLKDNQHEFLPDSFVALLVGKPGSGKSCLIRELLLNNKLYFKKFKRVYIFSPYIIKDLDCQEGMNYFNNFNIETVYDLIDMNKNKKNNILFIIDDFISIIKQQQHNSKLTALFYNRRHLNKGGEISFLITTQKYYQFPSNLRTCLTLLFIFDVSRKEIVSINQDTSILNDKMINNLMKMVIKQKYSFIMVNLQEGRIFFKFDEILQ